MEIFYIRDIMYFRMILWGDNVICRVWFLHSCNENYFMRKVGGFDVPYHVYRCFHMKALYLNQLCDLKLSTLCEPTLIQLLICHRTFGRKFPRNVHLLHCCQFYIHFTIRTYFNVVESVP